jgi:hypothetical protein
METPRADRVSAIRIGQDQTPCGILGKKYIKGTLSLLHHTEYPAYALMDHLPARQFAIVRYFDYKRYVFGDDDLRAVDYYTIREFYKSFASFHKNDEFRILFGPEILTCKREFTVIEIRRLCEFLFKAYCEKRMRDNDPVRLSNGLIRLYGFTKEVAAIVNAYVEECNSVAQVKIQAEYDAVLRNNHGRYEKTGNRILETAGAGYSGNAPFRQFIGQTYRFGTR